MEDLKLLLLGNPIGRALVLQELQEALQKGGLETYIGIQWNEIFVDI